MCYYIIIPRKVQIHMAKKKERKPPTAQVSAQPSTFSMITETAGTIIARGLQIARTSAYGAGIIAYDLFQRFYQAPEAIAPEAPRTSVTAEPTPKATETAPTVVTAPATAAPQTPIIKKLKRKKIKPTATETPHRAPSESNVSGGTFSEVSSVTARTTTPDSRAPETPSPKTAEDIIELLNNKLPAIESIEDNAQGKYHCRHLQQLQKCLERLTDIDLSEDRYEYYEAQIATIGPSIENHIITIGQIYNQLISELAEPDFEQKLFCMLPYTLAGAKVSGQKAAEVLERLEPLRKIFAAQEIKIDFFLCGTSILAPRLAQDIDITMHFQTTDGATLAPELFTNIFLALEQHLTSLGFNCGQLIFDRRHTRLASMRCEDGETIKVDFTCYNTSVEEALNKGITNISAVYLGCNGDMHATKEIKEFYTDSGTAPKVVMRDTAELSETPSNAYEHIQKVHGKARHMGWNSDSKFAAWLRTNSDKPVLASPPRSSKSSTTSTSEISPIATAFHAAVIAKREAAALAASAAGSP